MTFKMVAQSRIWISLGAASMNIGASILMRKQWFIENVLMQFYVFLAIYLLNKISDFEEDSYADSKLAAYYKTAVKPVLIIIILYLFVAILLSSSFMNIIGILFPFFIGIAYSFPMIPINLNPLRFIRFKDIIFLKNISVAFTWGIASILLQKDLYNVEIEVIFSVSFLIFIRMIINTLLFDLRDIDSDKKASVMTIPVYLGYKFTIFYSLFLNFIFVVSLIYFCIFDLLSMSFLLLSFLSIYSIGYTLYLSQKRNVNVIFYDSVVDGELILFGLICLVTLYFI